MKALVILCIIYTQQSYAIKAENIADFNAITMKLSESLNIEDSYELYSNITEARLINDAINEAYMFNYVGDLDKAGRGKQ